MEVLVSVPGGLMFYHGFPLLVCRVVPMLSYRDRKLLHNSQKKLKGGGRSGSRASRSSRISIGDLGNLFEYPTLDHLRFRSG